MADKHSDEGGSTGNFGGESSESTVEIRIKTLDSQSYQFNVDKNVCAASSLSHSIIFMIYPQM